MRVRFQGDEDLDGRGLRRAAPEVDIQTAVDAGLVGLKDPDILRIYADSGRILVRQDLRTMPAHFARYVTGAQSPGVIVLREAIPIATALEAVTLLCIASEEEARVGRLAWIPL